MLDELVITRASVEDAAEIVALQRLCFLEHAERYGDFNMPPMRQTVAEMEDELRTQVVLKCCEGGRIIASARGRMEGGACQVGRVMVHPQHRGRRLGARLLDALEEAHPNANGFELFTGERDDFNVRFYQNHGYEIVRTQQLSPMINLVVMTKKKTVGAVVDQGPRATGAIAIDVKQQP